MASFAEKLKALREAAGLSKYALAKRTGLSAEALSLLEQDKRQPTWETVQLIARALGVETTQFEDESMTLPEQQTPAPRGRPRKEQPTDPEPTPPTDKPKRKGKRKSLAGAAA